MNKDPAVCKIEVIFRKMTARSVLVSGQEGNYSSNYQASLCGNYIAIPKSQIRQSQQVSGNRYILTLPRWIVIKNGLQGSIIGS